MTKIGYIGGSFKPFHAGHYAMIRAAANECDLVNVYVSLSDRIREGEYGIKGAVMHEIWAKYLLAIMPSNVDAYFVSSPVRSIYETVGEADKSDNTTVVHIIYSDNVDAEKNYPQNKLSKYFARLTKTEQLNIRPLSRTNDTINVSGTSMRRCIQLGLDEDFIKGLPEPVQMHGKEIWKLLGGGN